MNITSAKYIADMDGNNTSIKTTIDELDREKIGSFVLTQHLD